MTYNPQVIYCKIPRHGNRPFQQVLFDPLKVRQDSLKFYMAVENGHRKKDVLGNKNILKYCKIHLLTKYVFQTRCLCKFTCYQSL